jgi:hypothetical protein
MSDSTRPLPVYMSSPGQGDHSSVTHQFLNFESGKFSKFFGDYESSEWETDGQVALPRCPDRPAVASPGSLETVQMLRIKPGV